MPKLSKIFLSELTNTDQPSKGSGPHLAQTIVDNSNGRLRYGGRKAGAYRIQRVDPDVGIPAHELKGLLKKIGYKVIEIIPPGSVGASSGKFNTYVLQYGEIEFPIVFGQGRNGGQRYEDIVLDDLKKSQKNSSKGKKVESELYNALLRTFKIKPNQVKEIKKVASRAVRRPVTQTIANVGSIVSDIDIILKNGNIFHISLKDLNGSTFANSGYTGGIDRTIGQDGKPFFTPGSHELDQLLFACGVDKNKVVKGLNDYVRNTPTKPPFKNIPVTFDADTITKYLASAYGYGYWYVRPNRTSRGGGYQIVNIDSEKAALNKVGNVNSVTVSYPYWTPEMSSKQITIKIDTDTAFYKIEVRNSRRKVIPNEFKIKIEKMKA